MAQANASWFAVTSLQKELGKITGVADAIVDAAGEGPVGVRVTVAAGFDRAEVAQAVRELLAMRGLSSVLADPVFEQTPSEPTREGRTSTPYAVLGSSEPKRNGGLLGREGRPPPVQQPTGAAGDGGSGQESGKNPVGPPGSPLPGKGVSQAAVSEGSKGLEVAVRLAGGERGTSRGGNSVEALYRATTEAVYTAIGRPGPPPVFHSVEFTDRALVGRR